MTLKNLALVLGAVIAVTGGAAAAADNVRVRGTVSAFDGSTLTVKTREGQSDAIKLTAGWKVSGVAKASLGDIKVGDFVGVASAPTADGSEGALEVVIFPAALKGTGEGSRAMGSPAQQQHDQRHRRRCGDGRRRPNRDAHL